MTNSTVADVFRDPAFQAEFARSGIVQHRLLSPIEADALLAEIKQLETEAQFELDGAQQQSGEYLVTNLDSHESLRRNVHDLAFAHLKEKAESLLIGYRALSAWLFIKPAGASEVPIHRDWSMQADHDWPTINVWFALEDVDESNGIMEFVERSYRLFDFPVSPMRPVALAPGDTRMDPYKTARPARKGEALIFDAGMYHGSRASTSSRARYAITITCIPEHRQPVMFNIPADNPAVMQTIRMDTQDHLENSGEALLTGRMTGEVLATVPLERFRHITIDRVMAAIEGGVPLGAPEDMGGGLDGGALASPKRPTLQGKAFSLASRIRGKLGRVVRAARQHLSPSRPVPRRAPVTVEHAGTDFAPYPVPRDMPRPFADPAIDEPLHRQGYATLPFLDEAEVDRLTAAIRAAEGVHDRGDVHIPTQFRLSAFNNDGAYKERLFDAVWETLKARVETLLPGFEPLVINLFDKQPGSGYDPVPIHQNPSFVDEPAHKSVSLWIPLDDVDKDNGTVGVLPGSHNRFNRMRAGNMAHEDIFAPVQRELEQELFVPVVLKKGEMLALDDSIIHWSYPNVSDRPRVAVQLIMVPKGVPHIYYFYDDETPGHPMMDLYEVDRHFFFGFNCKARPVTLKQIDRVPYRYRPIIAAELTAH